MTSKHLRLAGLAAVAGTLAVPAVAAAHPAAWEITPQTIPAGQTPDGTWTQANLVAGPKQVAAYNHNNTKIYVEGNGRTDEGLLNFRKLPGAYRSQISKARWFSEGGTGIQTHDTCEVPALTAESAVLAWQGGPTGEPFWSYVPFQPTAAQLDDDPADWIPVVQTATGVNLADPALAGAAAREAACEALPGATASSFRAADTVSSTTNSLFTFLTNPLNLQITSLTADKTALQGQVSTLTGQVTTLTGERDAAVQDAADAEAAKDAAVADAAAANTARTAAEAARAKAEADKVAAEGKVGTAQAAATAAENELAALKLATTTLKVVSNTLPSLGTLASAGHGVTIEGPAGRPAQVRILVTDARRRSMKLKSRVLGSATTTLGADARGATTVKLGSAAAAAVRKLKGSLVITVDGTSGDRHVAQTVTLKK